MKFFSLVLSLVCLASTAEAGDASVIQVSKSGRVIALSQERGTTWQPNEKFSVIRYGREIASGRVIKIDKGRALASVESYEAKISAGDEVTKSWIEDEVALPSKHSMRMGIVFGITGGTATSQAAAIDGVNGQSTSAVLGGFSMGLNTEIPLSQYFYFEPELSYASKSYAVSIPSSFSFGGETIPSVSASKLSYLETYLPIKVKADTGAGPYLSAGPYLGYLLSSASENYGSLQYGLGIEGGLDIRLGKGFSLVLGFRYLKGMNSAENNFSESRFTSVTGLHFPL